MYFTKAIFSMIAIAGFAAAQAEDLDHTLASREAADNAREEYLVARDAYLAARDDYLATRKVANKKKGFCGKSPRGGGMICMDAATRSICGMCPSKAKNYDTCYCN